MRHENETVLINMKLLLHFCVVQAYTEELAKIQEVCVRACELRECACMRRARVLRVVRVFCACAIMQFAISHLDDFAVSTLDWGGVW